MERKDLIAMASEAGFGKLLTGDGLPTMWHGADLEMLDRFAKLVAAAELSNAKAENVKPTCSACNTVGEPGKPGLYHTGGEGCRLAGNGKADDACENCHGTGKGYGEVACAYCDAGKSGESGYDLSAVTHLTHNKAKHIIESRNYQVTGFVLTNADKSKCIVDMSAVRWFDDGQDFFRMMHPDAAPPASHIGEPTDMVAPTTHDASSRCWCRTCRPITIDDMRFVVCPDCGNKRCPKANDHIHACTGSNEPGQIGSAYPTAPSKPAGNPTGKCSARRPEPSW